MFRRESKFRRASNLFSFSSVKLTTAILTASLLAGCGFHLRGDYSVPEEFNTLSLTSYDSYSTFTRMMKGQLRMNEINVVEPAEDVPNLHLISESVGERTLSLYQTTRAAEKEITFNASYRVTAPNIGSKTLSTSVTRSYLDNPLTALAKSVERDMIADEMRQLAATQIIRQMARLKADIEKSEQLEYELDSEDDIYHIETVTEEESNNSYTAPAQ
ncbi:LPS-assembly lipoprotein LptE [Vibrio japonicus]|uniref:LPS-assembly lipoprotein LptE n=1 Tax=Vibrio japonicus TaxID=1824638 RepID=A0ABY5LGP2_9VIBR|nr:LPS assembly lipoprotein LptE [Vibrio japonicus]UUM31214.1 LPS assembly lipoprotein LptE [Vibrio japonicus]